MKTKRLKLKWPNAAHKPFARWSAQRHTLLKKIAYTPILLSYTTNGIPGVTTILEQVIILRISLWRAFFKNPFVDCDDGVEAGEDDIEPNTPQEVKVWITFTTIEMRSMSKTHSSISRRYVLIIIPQLWCNTHWVCSCRVAYGRLGWATSWVALSDAQ